MKNQTNVIKKPVSSEKDHIKPTVLGKGYIGTGKYRSSLNGVTTPAYMKWRQMLARCYSSKYHANNPAYIGCSVSDEWLNFQNFAAWFEVNNRVGLHLDKDLIIPSNKIYSAENCVFVSKTLNDLIREHKDGKYLAGTTKSKGKFIARIGINNMQYIVDRTDNEQDAHRSYCLSKAMLIRKAAKDLPVDQHKRPEVRAGLLVAASMLDYKYRRNRLAA